MSLEDIVLTFSAGKLDELCGRIEACVDQLTPEEVWSRNSENANSIGNLMLHLSGNVRQWILHGAGGAPDVRHRDAEFETRNGVAPAVLKQHLRMTVDEACALLRTLPHERLPERRTIQKHEVTVLEAILHVVEHFSQHTGQIIFITKHVTGDDLGFYPELRKSRAQEMP
jgi:uncharacterized damage-inducible protein DinB